jgi:hypothetical protein
VKPANTTNKPDVEVLKMWSIQSLHFFLIMILY